ncbi:hypothetical protein GQ53DRAFT_788087 [Thozetella sp. PMI_491]|nr:hypothetical protein GQ53DRAFT_788087 [Thozetella sp. PMI_491]
MRFSVAVVAALATYVAAAPTQKRAVFTTQKYNDISISGGVAGNGKAEADAVFAALDLNDLANADEADVDFLKSVNSIANKAEVGVFNPAIEAASGEAAAALQRGKIKNKILKITATMLRLGVEKAQGEDVDAEIAAEQKKLDNNISQDTAAKGKASTFLAFDATTA